MNQSKYVYPATLHPEPNGGYSIWFDDLPGCATGGDTLSDALSMAQDAMSGWIYAAEKRAMSLPEPSEIGAVACADGETVTYVIADIESYRRAVDSRAVKKTLTIPAWLNDKAEAAHVNYSGILRDALIEHLSL